MGADGSCQLHCETVKRACVTLRRLSEAEVNGAIPQGDLLVNNPKKLVPIASSSTVTTMSLHLPAKCRERWSAVKASVQVTANADEGRSPSEGYRPSPIDA